MRLVVARKRTRIKKAPMLKRQWNSQIDYVVCTNHMFKKVCSLHFIFVSFAMSSSVHCSYFASFAHLHFDTCAMSPENLLLCVCVCAWVSMLYRLTNKWWNCGTISTVHMHFFFCFFLNKKKGQSCRISSVKCDQNHENETQKRPSTNAIVDGKTWQLNRRTNYMQARTHTFCGAIRTMDSKYILRRIFFFRL